MSGSRAALYTSLNAGIYHEDIECCRRRSHRGAFGPYTITNLLASFPRIHECSVCVSAGLADQVSAERARRATLAQEERG